MDMTSEGASEPQQRDWNKWLTASVGVATAIAGLFQFYYKEIFAPAKVPVNIALDLKIKPLKADPKNETDVIMAMMHIKVSNKGVKSVYLKSPTWTAFGMYRTGNPRDAGSFSIPTTPLSLAAWCPKMNSPKGGVSEDAFVSCLNQQLAPLNPTGDIQEFMDRIELLPDSPQPHQNHARDLIASGPVGKDRELKPGQEILSQVLIPVSKKSQYHYLEALISVPTVSGVSSDEAEKIASAVFLNLQESEVAATKTRLQDESLPKLYQKLRGFCLAKAKPASLVDRLKAFRLPRRDDGDMRISLDEGIAGVCYNTETVPTGNFSERSRQFVRHVLKTDESNRFGAQFYDSTFEVPLQPLEEAASSQQNTNP
jgi:hypothetical protein